MNSDIIQIIEEKPAESEKPFVKGTKLELLNKFKKRRRKKRKQEELQSPQEKIASVDENPIVDIEEFLQTSIVKAEQDII